MDKISYYISDSSCSDRDNSVPVLPPSPELETESPTRSVAAPRTTVHRTAMGSETVSDNFDGSEDQIMRENSMSECIDIPLEPDVLA